MAKNKFHDQAIKRLEVLRERLVKNPGVCAATDDLLEIAEILLKLLKEG